MQVDLDSVVVRRRERVMATELERELAIMDVERGKYYWLDDMAGEIWRRIEHEKRVGDLCAELLADYEVDHARCEREVLAFVTQLVGSGLAERVR